MRILPRSKKNRIIKKWAKKTGWYKLKRHNYVARITGGGRYDGKDYHWYQIDYGVYK